jgi:hypothetical protein
MYREYYRVTVAQALANAKKNAENPKNSWLDFTSIVIYAASAAIWGITLFPGNKLETLPIAIIASFTFGFFLFLNQALDQSM